MLSSIHEIRFANLKKLHEGFIDNTKIQQHGSIQAFGTRLGISPRFLAHLLACRKKIGTATARKVEVALNLPSGWMDHEHSGEESALSSDEKAFIETMVALYRKSPFAAREEMVKLVRRRIELADRLTVKSKGVTVNDDDGRRKKSRGGAKR